MKRLNRYDKIRMELMLRAQRKSNPKFGLKRWSPILARTGTTLRKRRKELNSLEESDPRYETTKKKI